MSLHFLLFSLVLFKIHDPADLSPYATMATIGDNYDKVLYYLVSNYSSFEVINSTTHEYCILLSVEDEVTVARVTFDFSASPGGDNFQVYASLDSTFLEDKRAETTCMIVWTTKIRLPTYTVKRFNDVKAC